MLASTAGCSGDDTSGEAAEPDIETTDGPAEFAVYDVSWSDGTDVAVDTGATLDIVIGNRGGEPGELEFQAVIESLESEAAPPVRAETSTIEEPIGSGDTVTVTTETLDFGYAGRYEVTGADGSDDRIPTADTADGDTEIDILPRRASGEETQQLGNELRLTVEEVTFEQHLHYTTVRTGFFSSDERVGVHSALNDQTLALVHATVENAGNNGTTLDGGKFTFAGERPLRDLGGSSLDSVRDVDGSPLDGASVNPGSSVSGWLLFNVPRDALDDASLAFHRDSTAAPADVIWDVALGEVDLPAFELVDMDVPSERAEGTQEFEFTIRNAGDGVGTFRGEIEWREGTSGEWDGLLEGNAQLSARVPAGSETTVTTGSDNDELYNTYEYRLNPFGATFVIKASE
ncbi:hypothetical protein C464_06940 [Halorubrum coriense DSM 10284]|uniref:DUF4352 domain-containing protein n=1 Tax=Halorubrum coriense DSM 10284 TaxID=1227466 RepID=M0EKY2_9EURY|nr:DUF4352 domain-containing protein [Halorubrum coriense]ELZ48415.1 hypothetical protein C464_06940 [Halorubrum coriense DSM 10284]